MLKIKDNKWVALQEKYREMGFEINDTNSAFIKRHHLEEGYPNDYFEMQIWFNTKGITIETSNDRYAGFSTDGSELNLLYDLIMSGLVEKTHD